MSDLLDAAARVPFLVWVMVIGPLAYAAVALVLCVRAEQRDPAERARSAAIREEYLAWRHPRRVHRGRK